MPKKLVLEKFLSEHFARNLVFTFIRHGEHDKDHLRNLPDEDMSKILTSEGYDLEKEISSRRSDPHKAVTYFENLLDGTPWEITVPEGMTVNISTVINGETFFEKTIVEHGFVRQAFKADFLSACEARDRSIERSSFDDFYTALSKGFSSVEAYLNFKLEVHNRFAPEAEKLSEKRKKGGFLSLEEKLLDLFPKMTGNQFSDQDIGWKDLMYLKDLRNNVVIHPKPGAGLTTLEELADGLNKFRSGLAGLMFMLHRGFGDRMQSSLIRANWYPTVGVSSSS